MLELLEKSRDLAVVRLRRRLRALGTPVYLSKYIEYVVWRRVEHCVDWRREAEALVLSLGLREAAVFFTALNLENLVLGEEGDASGAATVGPRPLTCLGYGGASPPSRAPGTINIFLVLNTPLSEKGLLDLFRIVSEVKGLVFSRHYPGCIGTVSDATLVAAPDGERDYLGGIGYSAKSAGRLVEVLIEGGLRLWSREAP